MLGLQWLQVHGKDPLLDAKSKAKAGKTPYGIIRGIDRGDDSSGFQVGMTSKKVKGSVYAGSAHLANIHPSVIGIEKLDDDLYWICVADSGGVLPGYDVVSTDSEVKMLLSELSAEYELDYMTMVMSEEVANKFGLVSQIKTTPFELFISDEPLEAIKIKSIVGVPYTFYLGGFIVLASLGMGGMWAHEKYEKKRELEEMIAIQQAAQAERERKKRESSKVDTEADILAQALEEEKQWLRDDFNRIRLAPLMQQIFLLNESLPYQFTGWKLEGLFFSNKLPNNIVSMWVNEDGLLGTLNALFDGSDEGVSFSPDLKTARVGHSISLGLEGISDILDHIKTQGTHHQELYDILTSSGASVETRIKQEEARREPIARIADESLKTEPQLIISQRHYSIKVQSKESFMFLMQRLDRVKNFMPELIHIEKSGADTQWTISGTLYEN